MKKIFTSLAFMSAMAFGANAQTTAANDNCSTATPLTLTTMANYATEGTVATSAATSAATASGMTFNLAGTAEDDLWFSFVATKATATVVVETDANYDAVVEVYKGTCNALTFINGDDYGVEEDIEVIDLGGLTVGETYYIRVYDYYDGSAQREGEFLVAVLSDDICGNNTNPLNVSITADATAGTLTANITGGTAPYEITWVNLETEDETTNVTTLSNISAGGGAYVSVMDADSCFRYTYATLLPTFDATPAGVSVSEVAAQYNMSVFPNPAATSATLKLETASYTDLQIELVNIAGQVVYTQSVAQEGAMQYELPVANLVSGVYFVKVTSKAGTATQKLVIAK